jgi:hypothetical protein
MNETGADRTSTRSVTAMAVHTRGRRWLGASATGVLAAASAALLGGVIAAWLLRDTGLSAATVLLCVSVPAGLVAGAVAPVMQWALARGPYDRTHP